MPKEDIWQWLSPLAHRWGAEEALREQTAVLFWSGTALRSLAQPLYVDRGVLHLAVESHVVAAELNLLKSRLLARLNEGNPTSAVVDLRFQVRSREVPSYRVEVPAPTKDKIRDARHELPARLPARLRNLIAEALAWARARDEAILDAGGWRCPRCEILVLKDRRACPACGCQRAKEHR